jgi:hypothetical protein
LALAPTELFFNPKPKSVRRRKNISGPPLLFNFLQRRNRARAQNEQKQSVIANEEKIKSYNNRTFMIAEPLVIVHIILTCETERIDRLNRNEIHTR